MENSRAIIDVQHVSKSYHNIIAVNNLSLQVPCGSCFGLLGPNGAGKTTLVEMMEGMLKPSTGQILYKNKPVNQRLMLEAGIQFQATRLQDFLTVEDNLKLYRQLYPKGMDLEGLIERCQLKSFLKKDTNRLSGGEKQRLYLALALVNNPQILFLDEPSIGLDPHARHLFWDLINEIKSEKRTIILTTHYLEEAEYLCDTLAIIHKGKIIAQGSPKSLIEKYFDTAIVILPKVNFTNDVLQKVKTAYTEKEHNYIFYPQAIGELLQFFLENKISLSNLEVKQRSLNDVFLYLSDNNFKLPG